MKKSNRSSYLNLCLILYLASLILVTATHSLVIRFSTENYVRSLLQDYRREIVGGNISQALQKLSNKIGDEFAFSEIAYKLPSNETKYLKDAYPSSQENSYTFSPLRGYIVSNIYFDKSETELAISFIFYYRSLDHFWMSLIAWLLFCIISTLIAGRFYSLNKLAREIENRAERSTAVEKVVQSISHDMRAPLGTFERLLQSTDEALPSMRTAVRDSLNRLNSMIESLRHSEVENLVKKSPSRVNFLFGRESLQGKANDHDIELHIPAEDPGEVWIDPMKVERAWINLASNALEAAKSFVRVEAEKVNTSLFIRVIDDGPGVPDDILPKLFQRGMTSGKAGGTGLGLAYVRQVMQGHGGDVTYRRENGLTIFECYLPHAVDHKKAKSLGEEESKVIESEVKPKQISVCFTPASYGESLISLLVDFQNPCFKFTNSYLADSEVVVTNDEELSMRSLDEGKETISINKALTPEDLASRLAYRLNIKR